MPERVPAVVLSGGLSSRLGQPKALVTVNNKSLLSIAYLRSYKIRMSPNNCRDK